MDVAMPIEDFLKFSEIAPIELSEGYSIISPVSARHFVPLFLRMRDEGTTMIENIYFPDNYSGAWLDIMPLSGVPADELAQKKFIRKATSYVRLNYKTRTRLADQKSTLWSKGTWLAAAPFRLLPSDYFWRRYLKLISAQHFDEYQFTGYVWSTRLPRLIFPREWFLDYVEMDFEDTKMRCPIGWNAFLSQMFGDYMCLPPKGESTSGHHLAVVDLEHSFRDYQSGRLRIDVSKIKGAKERSLTP